MVDPAATRRALFRCLFLLVCAVLIFAKLLPLSTLPADLALLNPVTGDLSPTTGRSFNIPGPDLIFALMAAWILRRPRWAPLGLVVCVLVLTDILFFKPVGLWAAIALLALEFIRGQSDGTTEIPWPVEILLFSGVFTAATVTNAIVYLVFGLPLPGITTLILHILMTCALYPLMMLFTQYVCRVRRARPSDLDAADEL